jgi:hypothetical protein
MSVLKEKIMMIYDNALKNVSTESEVILLNMTLGKIMINENDKILIIDFIKKFEHYDALYGINKKLCNPNNYTEIMKLGCDLIDEYGPFECFSAHDYFSGKVFTL